jgi:hypothetical protein
MVLALAKERSVLIKAYRYIALKCVGISPLLPRYCSYVRMLVIA